MQNRKIELLSPETVGLESKKHDLDQIRQFSLLPDKRIGWNYPLDYLWIAQQLDQVPRSPRKSLDIGCGPGAIHGWIESSLEIDMVGLDVNRWEKDYVDVTGNFLDDSLTNQLGWHPGTFDLIVSVSSLEHQSIRNHKRSVRKAWNLLSPGGTLLITVAAAPYLSSWSRLPGQWNMSRRLLEKTYGARFSEFDFKRITSEYRSSTLLREGYEERFGKKFPKLPSYLSVGVALSKAN